MAEQGGAEHSTTHSGDFETQGRWIDPVDLQSISVVGQCEDSLGRTESEGLTPATESLRDPCRTDPFDGECFPPQNAGGLTSKTDGKDE
ncbi:MAG: hypothetical protein KDA80_07630 [Planctomycetaceae bacterium]|nr:hypothetical protein [Planctomycetaceae bacterium]